MRRWRAALPLLAALSICGVARPAQAKPQWNAGLETGVCASKQSFGLTPLGWCNALRADALFLAERGSDFALGPSLRLGTSRFDDLRLDAGISTLVPLLDSLPLVLEVGPHLRNFSEAGIYGSAFFGVRSFNYYGTYAIAAGLSITAEHAFGNGPSALWVTARIDGSWIAMPAIFLYNALK